MLPHFICICTTLCSHVIVNFMGHDISVLGVSLSEDGRHHVALHFVLGSAMLHVPAGSVG